MYSSLSFGAGGAVGSLLAGYLWEGVGAQWMYAAASVTALLAGLVAWWGIRETENQGQGGEKCVGE